MRRTVLIAIATVLFRGDVGLSQEQARLRVHLPRRLSVSGPTLKLGAICVIRSDDDEAARTAVAVPMGRAPFPREKITIDRRTILSRLAQYGITAGRVEITGAEKLVVMRNETVFTPAALIRSAEQFLETSRPGPVGCTWQLVIMPPALIVAVPKDVQLKPRVAKKSPKGFLRVEVAAMRGARELAVGQILFKIVYPVRQAVAVTNITRGQAITVRNARIRVVMSETRTAQAWTSPVGMVAARPIQAGKVIRPSLVRSPAQVIVVHRNQRVTMRIDGLGFVVSAVGQALQDGRPGDLIRVRNTDSKRIVTARVAPDGTVQPVYGER